jgi:outer membrane protein assembly factor BamA
MAALAGERDRHDVIEADVTIDTRLDPSFPRNAVYARAGVERVAFARGDVEGPGGSRLGRVIADGTQGLALSDERAHARRHTLDARGYVGVGRPTVGVRALLLTSDAALPSSEQPLLGGADTLRGYRAGYAADDNLAAVSVELRVPLNSPLSFGRFGVEGFIDWGTTWSAGARLRDQQWNRGSGGGVFFGAGPLIGDVAIAWPEHGGPRGHFALGVSF